MSIGLSRDIEIKVTVTTIKEEHFTFDLPTSRDEARQLAKKMLAEGFTINEDMGLRPGEEQYFPPAVIYKVTIHKTTNI